MITVEEARKGIDGWQDIEKKIAEEFIAKTSLHNRDLITISLFEEFDGIKAEGARYHGLKAALSMTYVIQFMPSRTVLLFFETEKIASLL